MTSLPFASEPPGSSPRLVRGLELVAMVAAATVAGVGAVVLVGWAGDVRWVKDPTGALVVMVPNTALLLLLLGISLELTIPTPVSRLRRILARTLVAGCACVAAATLAEDLLGRDFGIDKLLFDAHPARAAAASSLALLLASIAVLGIDVRPGRGPAEVLTGAVMAIGSLTLGGYLYGAIQFYVSGRHPHATGMAIHTSVALLTLGVGILAARPASGVMGTFTSVLVGGHVVRRMLVVGFLIPVLGYIAVRLQAAGVYVSPGATVVTAVAGMIVTVVITFAVGERLNEADRRRRRTEDEVARARALLDALVDASPVSVVAVDLAGKVELWNPAAERLFGSSAGEVTGKPLAVIPAEEAAAFAKVRERVLVGREVVTGVEQRRKRRDGSLFDARSNAAPLVEDGELVGMMALVEDITDRKRAEDALRRSEAQFRELIEQAQDAVFVADLEGRYTDVNLAACQMLRYPREELIGKTILDIILPEDVPRLAESREHLLVRGRVEVSEWTLLTRDGAPVPVEVSAKIHADGRWVAFVRDVSERKRNQEALERSAAMLARAQRVAHLGSWDWDLGTDQVTRSAELLELFGLEQDAVSPQRWSMKDYIHRDDFAAMKRAVEVAAREGRPYSLEHRILRTDGSERVVLHQGEPVFAGGRVVRMVGTLLDITERKQAENELERLRAEWGSVVAHDLRQPLNAFMLSIPMLARTDDTKLRERLGGNLLSAARRLDRMVGDLMDLSRLEARRLEIVREPTDVPTTVRTSVERVAQTAPDRRFDVIVHGHIPPASADADRVAQIVENLLSNAVKYGAPGTPIRIEEAGDGGELSVAVTNEGQGIPREEIPRLFHRFQRTESAKGGRIKGTGLGLYITRELVEAHGGRLTVESQPGATTTFRFTLPLA